MKWNLFQSRRTKKLRPTHVNAKPCRLAVEALEDRWLPSTITWLNNASGFFNVPTNWQGGVPTPSDDAIIPFSGITVTSSANVTVNSITCTGATLAIAANASFTAVGGGLGGTTSSISTLTLGSGSTLQASASTLAIGGGTSAGTLTALTGAIIAFNFNSGQFTMNSGSSLSGSGLFFVGGFETLTFNVDENAPTNFQLDNSGTVNGPGNLTITNTFTWTGGTLGGSSTTIVPAGTTLNISNNFNKFVTGSHVLNLAGTTTWTGTGELDGSPGSTINNSGTFTAQNDGVCGNGGQGAGVIFNNNTNGVFTKSGTTGTTSFAGNLLNNSGTVNINSGTLTLSGGDRKSVV